MSLSRMPMTRTRVAVLIAVIAVMSACGSTDAGTETAEFADLGSLADPAPETATSVSADVPVDRGAAPSFQHDVQPILETVCAQCHSPSGPGSTHWELTTASDAASFSPGISLVTANGSMPPWPASPLSVAFTNDFSLSDAELQILTEWTAAGAPLDVDPATPITSAVPIKRIVDPDLVVTSAKGAYTGSTDVLDDYRCLIFDPEITETKWITSSHFEPDQAEVVHHAIVTVMSSENRANAEALDKKTAEPGWTCYGGAGVGETRGYSFEIAGWAPGTPPSQQPEGYGIPLRRGDFIVVQIHYHFDDSAPADLSRMVFDFAEPDELDNGRLKTLTGARYLGPAEIPCVVGDPNPLCDRAAAQDRVRELYGSAQAFFPDLMLRQCGARVEDFLGMTDGTAGSTCDHQIKNPGTITSVTAHMHELGLAFRMTLNPDTPEEQILLDIPDWDFDWQLGYRPVDEIEITRSDTVRVECWWGRDRAPYEAVGWILWAEGTGDEMCYSSITTAPK